MSEGMKVMKRPKKRPVLYHGKPCHRCGGTRRFKSNRSCTVCTRKAAAEDAKLYHVRKFNRRAAWVRSHKELMDRLEALSKTLPSYADLE